MNCRCGSEHCDCTISCLCDPCDCERCFECRHLRNCPEAAKRGFHPGYFEKSGSTSTENNVKMEPDTSKSGTSTENSNIDAGSNSSQEAEKGSQTSKSSTTPSSTAGDGKGSGDKFVESVGCFCGTSTMPQEFLDPTAAAARLESMIPPSSLTIPKAFKISSNKTEIGSSNVGTPPSEQLKKVLVDNSLTKSTAIQASSATADKRSSGTKIVKLAGCFCSSPTVPLTFLDASSAAARLESLIPPSSFAIPEPFKNKSVTGSSNVDLPPGGQMRKLLVDDSSTQSTVSGSSTQAVQDVGNSDHIQTNSSSVSSSNIPSSSREKQSCKESGSTECLSTNSSSTEHLSAASYPEPLSAGSSFEHLSADSCPEISSDTSPIEHLSDDSSCH